MSNHKPITEAELKEMEGRTDGRAGAGAWNDVPRLIAEVRRQREVLGSVGNQLAAALAERNWDGGSPNVSRALEIVNDTLAG